MPLLFSLQGQSHGLRNKGIPALLLGSIPLPTTELRISGVTKDETGAAAAGFTVYLFDMTSGTPVLSQTAISDGSGNYSFSVGRGGYWLVDYRTGSPDKAGASAMPLAGL